MRSTTTGGNSATCPSPITKPAALIAAEPTPADPCARVSNAIDQHSGSYSFGYTNGEVWLVNVTTLHAQRVDLWSQSGVSRTLPHALVTAQFAPANNFEGALEVGYADPTNSGIVPWYSGMAGTTWMAGSASPAATVLGISACPFHGAPTHLELLEPWTIEETVNSTYAFSAANTDTLNQHLQLGGSTYVTAIETITSTDGWRVIVGTEVGEIYLSNLLTGTITWDSTTQTLSKPVSWTRVTDSNMPQKWVTRVAVHPVHQERILVTFGSTDTNTVWFSEDSGQTWSNRHANLPTATSPDIAPPVVGASFNPLLDGAAYVVTPQTVYYTLDYGNSGWAEW